MKFTADSRLYPVFDLSPLQPMSNSRDRYFKLAIHYMQAAELINSTFTTIEKIEPTEQMEIAHLK